jgi:hypothetical protein
MAGNEINSAIEKGREFVAEIIQAKHSPAEQSDRENLNRWVRDWFFALPIVGRE